jgi:polyisoprenoid-binding protein YceI
VTAEEWTLDGSDGELLVKTGVTGRAARLGHRLTIGVTDWQATVKWARDQPVGVDLIADVDSLEVQRGEGGATPLTGPEKKLARSNALGVLDADRFPQLHFRSTGIEMADDGYRITGVLEIHGTDRECIVDLRVEDRGDRWRMSSETEVRQSDFGIKPYSMFLGSMKVADTVSVSFVAERAKDG